MAVCLLARRDVHALYAENFGDLLDFVRMVADSEREVVCRSFKAPAAEEGAHVGLEFRVGVRVSGRRNGARHGFSFRDYKLELAVGLYAYRVGFLKQYPKWKQAPIEALESLEQLRALWYGVKIAVAILPGALPAGVDTQEDLERVREAFGKQA